MDQPVVRHRLAKCGAQLEAQWAWTESFVYAMVKLPKKDADVELGGLTAAAKAQAGVVLKECADCAVLLFGGNGFTRSGQGEIAESKSTCERVKTTGADNDQRCGEKYLETVFRAEVKMSYLIYRSDNWSRTIRIR
jgi:alkylation response protein AidB-like acyl-CoA dehydrogenase